MDAGASANYPALPASFYDRPTPRVAEALLGCLLVRLTERGPLVGRLVETEAYVARDEANHAFRGPTPRNRSMFGPPGTLYVYRIHQVHCANVVTRPGEAVLLRAAAPVTPGLPPASGPGRLCRAFGIGRADDGRTLTSGDLRLVGRDRPRRGPVAVGARVGISKAVDRPLRFALAGDPHVSSPKPWRRRAVA